MIKSVLNIVSLLLVLSFSACSSNKILSERPKNTVVIDGKYNEWQGVPLFFNKEPSFLFGASNTGERINLIFRSNDTGLIRQMRLFGFTLWLDKNKKKGLELPGRMGERETLKPADYETRKKNFTPAQSGLPALAITTNDFFLKMKDTVLPLSQAETKDVQIASGYENGVFTIEFGLPLLAGDVSRNAIGVMRDSQVKLGLELKGRWGTRSGMSVGMKGGGRMGGGGMGGGMAGGGRGRMGGAGASRPSNIESKTIWFKIRLGSPNAH